MPLTPEQIDEKRLELDEARLKFEKRQSLLQFVTAFGAIATFAWTAYTYIDARNHESETKRVEATRPYLDRQIALYEKATSVAARIAVAGPRDAVLEDKKEFWQLYWGGLALVEGQSVEGAMKNFGDSLQRNDDLKQASLNLAHECREELAKSWNTDAWSRRNAAK